MAKRPSKHTRPHRELRITSTGAEHRDGQWIVRPVAGAAATKAYRCPGCDLLIAPGTPHVVVWPAVPPIGGTTTIEDRRHWHSGCWSRR